MKLIIDIPKDLYAQIYSDAEIMICGGMRSGKTLFATLLRSVRNGTPFPKNHGRLIDADELYDSLIFPTEQFAKGFKEVLDDAPTVIEAEEEKQ